MEKIIRQRLVISGQVQGVGFRPFVYRLALDGGLTGLVGNSSAGVAVEIQGDAAALAAFRARLENELPPLAVITALRVEDMPALKAESAFAIAASAGAGGHDVLISPDVAVCADCLADMAAGRRRDYAFTNCTNCGPRFTITRSIPYDRAVTSMACFAMCPDCLAEYRDPLDRRFHAQPNACPACGPGLCFMEAGEQGARPDFSMSGEALRRAARALASGAIVAVKGLGGFHLACDACDEAAVAELRRRKNRPHKPLAVMARDLRTARALAVVSAEAESLLASRQAPITLCPARGRTHGALACGISPDSSLLGIMLPYTPLHHVLMRLFALEAGDSRPAALVMTSGNAGGDPICLGNREALARLAGLADAFLLHNRDILTRVDDSVVLPPLAAGATPDAGAFPPPGPSAADAGRQGDAGGRAGPSIFYRRARGYVPAPLPVRRAASMAGGKRKPSVMGVGAELKATVCLNRGAEAFVSQHIGDLQNPAVYGFYREAAEYLSMLLQTRPEACVRDLHPDYLSGRYAEESGLPALGLQHHFAHAFSVLGENEEALAEPCKGRPALVLALDGTGLGDDGTIWGGELLLVNTHNMDMRRLGRLSPFALPGGEAAIREPWRIAEGLLGRCGADGGFAAPWLPGREDAAELVRKMAARGINSPLTSSCGRLFDAVSALLGLCDSISYEGQAAVRLENAARRAMGAHGAAGAGRGGRDLFRPYGHALRENGGLLELDSLELFQAVLNDARRGAPAPLAAWRFHAALAGGFAAMAARCAAACGALAVGLSGGVMQNATLVSLLKAALAGRGLSTFTHAALPPNDGCISFGQVYYGILHAEK